MPIRPSADSAALSARQAWETGQPHLLLREGVALPANYGVDQFYTCGVFDPDDRDTADRYGDPVWNEMRQAGYAVYRPAATDANTIAQQIANARHRQIFVSGHLLAAVNARAGTADIPIPQDMWIIHALRQHWIVERKPLEDYLPVKYGEDFVAQWDVAANTNVMDYGEIYQRRFNAERISASAILAVECLAGPLDHVMAPLNEFLPTPLDEQSQFSSMMLRAFHGEHNPALDIHALQALIPAFAMVAAVGRLARDGRISISRGLVRDARVLCDLRLAAVPDWLRHDDDSMRALGQINEAAVSFVDNYIGMDELVALIDEKPGIVPDRELRSPRVLPLLPDLMRF
jgi:hypothetical protein